MLNVVRINNQKILKTKQNERMYDSSFTHSKKIKLVNVRSVKKAKNLLKIFE